MPIPFVWIYWVISLTIATYAGAVVVRRFPGYGFATLTGLYIIYLGASQIIAARLIEFDIGIATFIAPASVFIYPFVAQAIDMINEVYGRPMTRVAIAIALLSQILLAVLIAMTNSLTPAPVFAPLGARAPFLMDRRTSRSRRRGRASSPRGCGSSSRRGLRSWSARTSTATSLTG